MDTGCQCAQDTRDHRRQLLCASRGSAEAHRRDGDKRQDHDVLSGGFHPSRCGLRSRATGHDRPPPGARDAPCAEHHSRIARSAEVTWQKSFAPGARMRSSKPVRTRWRWTVCGDARSPWRFSPISRAIISITTRHSRTISRPSAACLKARARAPPATGVINIDDEYGQKLAGLASRTLTYGLEPGVDITTRKPALSFSGIECTVETPAGKIEIRSKLVGRTNVYNILAAIGAGVALDLPTRSHRLGHRAAFGGAWALRANRNGTALPRGRGLRAYR